MKKIFNIIILLIITNACNSQRISTNEQVSKSKFYYQDKFQNIINDLELSGYLNFESEICCDNDLLNTNEKIKRFSENLIREYYPFLKKSNKIIFEISEDKLSKAWFINAKVSNTFAYSDEIHLIIVKNNCKILYLKKVQ